jgi:hypothetical protein
MKRCICVKPSTVCELKFTEWTREDRLRQPVFLGMREDKNPLTSADELHAIGFDRRCGRSALHELLDVGDVALVDDNVSAGQDRLLGRVAGGGFALDERDELAQAAHERVDRRRPRIRATPHRVTHPHDRGHVAAGQDLLMLAGH